MQETGRRDITAAGAGATRGIGHQCNAWRGLTPWLVAALVTQAAYVLTCDRASIGGALPIGTAQGMLLQDIYGLSARWNLLGILGFWRGLSGSTAHTSVATVLASLVEVYGGGGRMALLMPGLALLLASEIAFAAAVSRLARSPSLAAVGFGLFSLRTRPWLAATGLFSVNTEWLSWALFAIAMSLLIAPPARRDFTTVFTCATLGLAILCFSSTAFACLLVAAALRLMIGRSVVFRPAPVAAAVAFILLAGAAVLLWAAGACQPVPNTGIALETERAAQCGYGLRTSFLYLVSFELGVNFVIAAVTVSVAAIVAALLSSPGQTGLWRIPRLATNAMFLAAVLVSLVCIQLWRRSADPIGSGLVDVPLTALILTGVAALSRRRDKTLPQPMRLACFGFGALCTVLPWATLLPDASVPRPRPIDADVASWLLQDAEINERSRARILVAPSLATLNGPGLSASFYETFGETAAFAVAAPVDEPETPAGFDYAALPAATEDSQAASDLLIRVEAHMVRRVQIGAQGSAVRIYSTPNIALNGASGDWLLAAGTTLRFDAGEIPRDKVLMLSGPDSYVRFVPVPPSVTAVATIRQGASLSLPARFVREGKSYRLYIDPAPLTALGGGRVDVALTFSRFFIPKDVGLNLDARPLAIITPTVLGLADRAMAFGGAERTP